MSIQLVNQINDQSCVHACVSMVTGRPVEELWERYPHPLYSHQELCLLIESKILPIPTARAQLGCYFPEIGTYFMSVPSLNLPGVLHRVVVKVEQYKITVFDPQKGRDERLFYQSDCMMRDSTIPIKSYCKVDLLDFESLADLRIGGEA